LGVLAVLGAAGARFGGRTHEYDLGVQRVRPDGVSSAAAVGSMLKRMELERCPYDMSPIAVEGFGDSFVISCDACGAVWEMHGASLRRLRAPGADTMQAVRAGLFPEALRYGKRAASDRMTDHAAR
jgi:hypothetical protein